MCILRSPSTGTQLASRRWRDRALCGPHGPSLEMQVARWLYSVIHVACSPYGYLHVLSTLADIANIITISRLLHSRY
jgi:hypothetical protein